MTSQSPNEITFEDLIDAFIEGAQLDFKIEHTSDCFHELERGTIEILSAIDYIYVYGLSVDRYFDFLDSLAYVAPMTQTCYAVTEDSAEDIFDYFSQFDNFNDFYRQAIYNMENHIYDWIILSADMNKAWEDQDPVAVFYIAGKAWDLFFNFVPSRSFDRFTLSSTFSAQVEFIEGFLDGTKVLDSKNMGKCIDEANFVTDSLAEARNEFAKGKKAHFKNGVFLVSEIFPRLRVYHESCLLGLVDTIELAHHYIDKITSIIDIFLNVVVHYMDIISNFWGFIAYTRNDEWFNSGQALGNLLYYILFV